MFLIACASVAAIFFLWRMSLMLTFGFAELMAVDFGAAVTATSYVFPFRPRSNP